MAAKAWDATLPVLVPPLLQRTNFATDDDDDDNGGGCYVDDQLQQQQQFSLTASSICVSVSLAGRPLCIIPLDLVKY